MADKNHKNGEITIEKLARMVVDGFAEQKREHQFFKLEVNSRFNRLEDRLDVIEENTHDLVNTDEKLDRRVEKLEKKVSVLEQKVILHKSA